MASVHDATFVCITDYELSMTNRHVYAALSVGSAALGFVGAAWQLANWGASLCPECGSGPSHDTRLGRLTSSMRGAMLLLIVRLALRGRRPPRTEPKPQQGRVRQRSRSNVVIVFNLALANLLACVGKSVV
ncbi:hypothetical protein BaRGS_00025263 [Batillaria attramentaria]|uniref:Uncharacterized protein n=1 Tax=Batillaria attramentaria TaxID=370345 RepID=A0ABD0K8P9_9CAEN